jgi:hypothetical protein
MKAELIGLKAGKKQQWLRLHRREVDEFYFKNGAEATKAEYGMGQATLERYLDRSHKDTVLNRLSQADRYVLEMTKAGISEVRGRVRDLEDWKEQVQPIIDVGRALINSTMRDIEAKVGITPLLAGRSQAQQLSRKLKK